MGFIVYEKGRFLDSSGTDIFHLDYLADPPQYPEAISDAIIEAKTAYSEHYGIDWVAERIMAWVYKYTDGSELKQLIEDQEAYELFEKFPPEEKESN